MQRNYNRHTIRKIKKVIDETPTVRTLIFSDDVMSKVLPAQFAMVWVPGINELPMSVMVSEYVGEAAFTVRKHGHASTGLYNVKVDENIGIRGPYGNSFDIQNGNILLVGGGTGLVPLVRLMKFLKPTDNVTVLIGAKTKDEVFFENTTERFLENIPHQTIVTTEDGSYGEKGLVTDMAENQIEKTKFNGVYTCGPELMMNKIVEMAHKKEIFVQASLERMMKCGMGICGSCCMGEELVCKDGTVFDGDQLLTNREFGKMYRNKAGIPENF